jgi:integrase
VRINQLEHDEIQRWLNAQEGSTATIRRNHRLLSAALNEAVRRDEIRANPAAGVRIPRRPRNTKRAPLTPPFTRDEYELIRASITPRYQVLVEFLGETGCRFGEAAALTPADVNLSASKVHFSKTYSWQAGGYTARPPKTEESDRVIRVGRSLLEGLDLSGRFVFTTQAGEPVKDNSFRSYHWQQALNSLPPHRRGHPHDLRHAHACWLLDAGVPIHAVQKRLGHRNVMMTLSMYGHAPTDGEDRILDVLESL